LVVFIVARKDCQRWVMTDSANVINRFGPDRLEYRRKAGIIPTAKHEILPN
jgi:hypothetical protein